MLYIKIIFLYFFRFIFGFISFLLLYFFMSWLMPFVKLTHIIQPEKNEIELFVQSNGIHTDFVLPVESELLNWNHLLPCSDFELVDTTFKYIAIGWGDKGFFLDTPTWSDLKFSTAFNAAFGLGSTAMHISYKRNEPQQCESCKMIVVSKKQYQQLIEALGERAIERR